MSAASLHRRFSFWASSCALVWLLVTACASRPFDIRAAPADVQDAYKVFSYRCSKCHSLSRPLNARVWTAQHWDRYVERMRRMPTSGITPADAQKILTFLHYYAKRRSSGDEVLEPDKDGAGSRPEEVQP